MAPRPRAAGRAHLLRQYESRRSATSRGPMRSASGSLRSTARPRSTRSRARRPARGCSAASCTTARRRWRVRKFGCDPAMAVDVLEHAHRLGLVAHGVSFQCRLAAAAVPSPGTGRSKSAATISAPALSAASTCRWSISGRLPTRYLKGRFRTVKSYGTSISGRCASISATRSRETIIEPGRAWSAMPGVIEAERRAGRQEERTRRGAAGSISTSASSAASRDHGRVDPLPDSHAARRDDVAGCVLAGPTCDSMDVLYEKSPIRAHQPRDRRQGADRGHGRLYGHLTRRSPSMVSRR